MQRNRTKLRAGLRPGLRPKRERGIVIVLVAVVMLFVVGAMAALSIDVVTLYTARSEAQLAADAAALAGARVLANSGATSDRTGTLLTSVETIPGPASVVATQVAEQNQVGGTYLTGANITAISFGGSDYTNPTITRHRRPRSDDGRQRAKAFREVRGWSDHPRRQESRRSLSRVRRRSLLGDSSKKREPRLPLARGC